MSLALRLFATPFLLLLCMHVNTSCSIKAQSRDEDPVAKAFDIPKNVIGDRLEHWLAFLGDDYIFKEVRVVQFHGAPGAIFEIADEQTHVVLAIVTESKRHMLFQITSSSTDFITLLGIDSLPKSSHAPPTWRQCWDSGCNELRVDQGDDGQTVVSIRYGWD